MPTKSSYKLNKKSASKTKSATAKNAKSSAKKSSKPFLTSAVKTQPTKFTQKSTLKNSLLLDGLLNDELLNENKATLIQGETLYPHISVGDLIALIDCGVISPVEVRDRLGFPEQEKTTELQAPIAIRYLEDGSLENLFADGKRLILPPANWKPNEVAFTAFDELPSPWHNTDFSRQPQAELPLNQVTAETALDAISDEPLTNQVSQEVAQEEVAQEEITEE